jgi:hypothetical protein
MKSHFPIKSWTTLAALTGIALAMVAVRAQADQWDKRTILTVDQPIQVMNTVLEPGKYVFKLADSNSDRHIVQIFNSDQTKIVDTILAIPNWRLQPTGDSRFMFWETPPGTVRALRAWFYPGDNFGQEFRYPKHLKQVAVAKSTVTETVTQAEAAPAPAEELKERPVEEQPVEIAQNNPPPVREPEPAPEVQAAPAPPAEPPAIEPAPIQEPAPQQLPKTASPYPLVGLGGLFAFGLYSLLRLKRLA